MGKRTSGQRRRAAAKSRAQRAGSRKPPAPAKSATRAASPEPKEFHPKKFNLTVIVSLVTILGLIGIAARLPADGAPGLILVAISVYVLTLVKDYLTGLMSVYGPVNVRNTLTLIRNYNVGLFLAFCLAMLAILTLILRSPALASSWGSLLPVRSRDVNALEVAVFSGELAVLAFGGWLWFRRLPKRPSPRFGYGNIAEGLGDLAWTLAMISIAFGAAGSTSNLDWLVVTGVFVPVLINLRRQRYRAPRGTAAGSPQTAKE